MELAAWLQVGFGLVQVLLTIKQIKSAKEKSGSQLIQPIRSAQSGWFARVFPYLNLAIIIMTLGNLTWLFTNKSPLSKPDYFAVAIGCSLLVFIALARYIDRILDMISRMEAQYSAEIRRLESKIQQSNKAAKWKSISNRKKLGS